MKIWKRIGRQNVALEWRLRIIGTGENDYKHYVQRNNLLRVSFEGVKDVLHEYEQASIFMMTSKTEGWGLTLTETQQNACVPIAFNSYSSIVDIISNGIDGFIVTDNDEKDYFDKLVLLMTNDSLRYKLAHKAVVKSHLFDKELIVAQ